MNEAPRALQRRAAAQLDRVRDAGGHAGRTPRRDSCRPRPQAGGGSRAASATRSRSLADRATIFWPGETEAGSAGTQPGRGIARRAHRDDDWRARGSLSRACSQAHRIDRLQCLRKSPPAGRSSTLPRNVDSPVPAEPGHRRRTGNDIHRHQCHRSRDRRWRHRMGRRRMGRPRSA